MNINKDAVDLLPCAKCGGEAELHAFTSDGGPYYIYCAGCALTTPNTHDRDEQINAWNRRALTTERTDDAVVELINQLRSIAPRRADGRAPPIAALNMDELCLWELNELMNKAADALAAMPTEQTNKVDEAVEVLKPFADGNLDVSESAVILGYPEARAALDRARAFLAKLGSTP
jgi:hypothetical protein